MSQTIIRMDLSTPATADNTKHPQVIIKMNKTYTNSRDVAAFFGKRHADVLRTIDLMYISHEFYERNFALVTYIDQKGEARRSIDMTKDGFSRLIMSFTGKEAGQFIESYIKRFNEMEAHIKSTPTVRDVSTQLLSNPQALLGALSGASQKVIALETERDGLGVMVCDQARTIHDQRKDVALA